MVSAQTALLMSSISRYRTFQKYVYLQDHKINAHHFLLRSCIFFKKVIFFQHRDVKLL